MSMHNWSEDGFGVPLFTGHNDMLIYKFIADNDENCPSLNEYYDAVEQDGDQFDLCDFMDEPPSWIVAGIINKLENVTVFKGYCSCVDTDQEEMIGIEPTYPWVMSAKEKTLTYEKAVEVLKKYSKILGIKDEPEYFEAYYCG